MTADHHFGHERIIELCDRPYKNVHTMDESLIKNWNAVVAPLDVVFVLGDFCWGKANKYTCRLNGHIIFITGSHDHHNGIDIDVTRIVMRHGGKLVSLSHEARDSDTYADVVLCGHVHKEWVSQECELRDGVSKLCLNVGVDVCGFTPVLLDVAIKRYLKVQRGLRETALKEYGVADEK